MININTFKSQNLFFKNRINKTNAASNITGFNALRSLSKDTCTFTGNTELNRSLMDAFDNRIACQNVRENAKDAFNNLRQLLKVSFEEYRRLLDEGIVYC